MTEPAQTTRPAGPRPSLALREAERGVPDGPAASLTTLRCVAVAVLLAGTAQAAPQEQTASGGAGQGTVIGAENASNSTAPMTADNKPSIAENFGALGDPGGLRAFLKSRGITYAFTYAAEVLGNPTGGVKRGASYEGRLSGTLGIDLGTLAGLAGSSIHASFFETNGRGLSGNNLRDLFTVSGIEAFPSVTLYRVYLEQQLADGALSLRVGQLAADFEFFESDTANLFLDSTFGFPAILANDLPSGGPAFPLATPGVRVKYAPSASLTVLAAVYDGDPAGPFRPGVNSALPQVRDLNGTLFRLDDPPLLLGEVQFAHGGEREGAGRPGTLKVGYFHHFGLFPDNAVPAGGGQATASAGPTVRGDDGVYGTLDQTIYRVPGTPDRGIAVFARASSASGDRNLIDLYADAGIAFKGLFDARPDDAFGLAAAYGRIAPAVQRQDYAAGTPLIRDFQAVVELTYQLVAAKGVSIRPDFQYVIHPGAHGVADPSTGQPIRNAAVFGLRVSVHY